MEADFEILPVDITVECVDNRNIIKSIGYIDGSIEILIMDFEQRFTTDSIKTKLYLHNGPVKSLDFGELNNVPFLLSAGTDNKLLIIANRYGKWELIYKQEFDKELLDASCKGDEIAVSLDGGRLLSVKLLNFEGENIVHITEKDYNKNVELISVDVSKGEFMIYYDNCISNKKRRDILSIDEKIISFCVCDYGCVFIDDINSVYFIKKADNYKMKIEFPFKEDPIYCYFTSLYDLVIVTNVQSYVYKYNFCKKDGLWERVTM